MPSKPAKDIAAQDLQVSSSRKYGPESWQSSASVENLLVNPNPQGIIVPHRGGKFL